jgi:hypothetical protein
MPCLPLWFKSVWSCVSPTPYLRSMLYDVSTPRCYHCENLQNTGSMSSPYSHVFEESSHVQHGIRLGEGMNRDESTSSNAERVRKETTIMTSDIPDQNKNSFLSPQSDLDVLAAVAHSAVAHAASDSTESMNFAPQDEASGWSDFLPQFELSREGFLMSAQTASRE